MPQDNLLREAIADAKRVRDTAIQNAKLSLEESFKPHLASMISTRLRNEAEGIEETTNEQTDLDSSGIGGTAVSVKNPGPKQPSRGSSDSSEIENPKQEIEAMGEGPVVEADLGLGGGFGDEEDIDVHPDGMGGADIDIDLDGGLGMDDLGGLGGGMGHGEENPDELDLESIIRELELDVRDTPHDPGAGRDQMPPAAHDGFGHDEGGEDLETNEGFDDPMAGAKVDGPIKVRKEGMAPRFSGGGSREVKSGQEVAETNKGLKSESASDQENARLSGEGSKAVKPGQEVTEEVDLDEILREMEAEESAKVAEASQLASENVTLKHSLREHREVIQFLREKLQEVNMLNAKLLYTNKLFKAYNLNGSQKMRVVETFDRATTMREVKIIYTTLAESLTGGSTSKKATAKAITEGMASRPMGSTKPRSETGILAEGNTQVARLQKLAGIKPKN